ncbi:MAG: AfsR/SARP family transcriptional regulator [Aggregatilineales bacterium]
MAHLLLHFFGFPEVQHDGRAVKFATRKALALLIYLAVEHKIESREKISTLFWPDSDSSQGRAALRSTLALLREALTETGSPHYQHLLIERDTLQFDATSDVEHDFGVLQSAAQVLRTLSKASASRLSDIVDHLKRATALYQGVFLEGFSLADALDFDDWASLQRESWHRKATQVFEALSRLQFEGGDLAGAIDTTLRWVPLDALNEEAHRRLMELYLAVRDRAAAFKAYEACCTILAQELKAEPTPETEALAERIRAGMSLPTQASAEASQPALAPDEAEPPLVGRIAEHVELLTAFRAARRGRVQMVTIVGEPGIGKVRRMAA